MAEDAEIPGGNELFSGGGPEETKGEKKGKQAVGPSRSAGRSSGRSSLSYLEKKEWETLPARIEALEGELAALHERMAGPDFFLGDPETIREATARSEALPREIEEAFDRWADLDQQMPD